MADRTARDTLGAMKVPILLMIVFAAMIYAKAHMIDRSVQPYTPMSVSDFSSRSAR
ncbi:MAG: hypothetical protein HY242_16830 [Afipia sp.]|nr:hypothetical protein [Afipia sp.]